MIKGSIERKIVANLWRRYRFYRKIYKRNKKDSYPSDLLISSEANMNAAWNATVSSSNLLYTGKC